MIDNFKLFIQQIAPISDEEFEAAASFFKEVTLAKGEYFIKQGQICRQIAYANEGLLRTYHLNDQGEEVTSCFCIKNGLTTSYQSFITLQPSSLAIQALEDTHLLVIDHEHLQNLYSRGTLWQQIGRVLAEQEFIVVTQYASMLSSKTAREKYLRLLKEQPIVVQRAKVEHIASYLGVTRRTLSRIRQEVSKSI